MKMFKHLSGFGACIVFFAISLVTASAQIGGGQIIYMYENGTAYITPSSPFPYNPSALEPNSGMSTLEYTLPFAGVAGDVLLQDAAGGPLSDVLRFDGNFHVFFFSDQDDPIPSLADVGLPAQLLANTAGPFVEQALGGGQMGVFYTPTANQPGFKAAAPGTMYEIVSDVPEPCLTALGGLSGVLLILKTLKRRFRLN
jgi:hypothetical protein